MPMDMSKIPFFMFMICGVLGGNINAVDIEAEVKEKEGNFIIDFRKGMNTSCFDDGVSDNKKGGWSDEGLNDFECFPELSFGPKKYRGYFFDFIDPKTNNGKNLLMTGMDKYWPEFPREVTFSGLNIKGKYIFVMHSEARCQKGEDAGILCLKYSDGRKAELPLRMGKELGNWYQGRWWSNYEEPHADAPEVLKKSKCDPGKYKKLGGKDFHQTVLKHATAVRWPVTQGLNSISRNWGIPVVFWGLKWANPYPEKTIKSISLESKELCLIAVAAITVTDKDFSLDRQTLGKMSKPPTAPADFFC